MVGVGLMVLVMVGRSGIRMGVVGMRRGGEDEGLIF